MLVVDGDGDVGVEESKGVGREIDVDEDEVGDEVGVVGADTRCEAVIIVAISGSLVSVPARESIAGIIVSSLSSVTSTLSFLWVVSSYTGILMLVSEMTEESVMEGEMDEDEQEDGEKSRESSLPFLSMLSSVLVGLVGVVRMTVPLVDLIKGCVTVIDDDNARVENYEKTGGHEVMQCG